METPDKTTHTKVTPILRWPGGKRRMLKHLLPLPPHDCYCEAFAGGLAVLLAKPRSPVEVVNDLNGDIVVLYRTVQYHLPELQRELEFMFGSRQMLKDFREQPGLTEIQRAARFLVRNRTSFGGTGTSLGVTRSAGGGAAMHRSKVSDLLGEAHKRIDGVIIEHLPYERCLALYDGPRTCFFLDPPYLHADPKVYRGWTEEEMRAFRGHVAKLKGHWIVTIDDSEFNRSLFKDCALTPVRTANGCVNNRTHAGSTFGELIVRPR